MKTYLSVSLIIVFIVIIFASCGSQKEATGINNTKYKDLIDMQQYTFVANNVIPTEDSRFNPRLMFPMQGNNLYQLAGGYDLRIMKDSITAYLPFFGRSFIAPINPADGGIKFTSSKFDYKTEVRRNNYLITIIPRDVPDIRNVYLTITPSGYAYLQVLSLNKTPISYNGYIEPNKK